MKDCTQKSVYFRVTADDFGYCKQRNSGILETISNGVVNSVSILMNGSDVVDINKVVQKGLHINLTEGRPISNVSTVASLLGPNLLFLGKFGFREKLNMGEILNAEVRAKVCCFIFKKLKMT